MTEYSNPRMQAKVHDWPSGQKRVTASFWVEIDPKRGQRACRETTGAAKKLTYASQVRVVDGDDGRTYIAELTSHFHMISIMNGDMKYQHEIVHSSDPRYDGLKASLFDAGAEPGEVA
jgi:hypothetical protein